MHARKMTACGLWPQAILSLWMNHIWKYVPRVWQISDYNCRSQKIHTGLELEGSCSAFYPKPFLLRSCDGCPSGLLAWLGLESLRKHTFGHVWNVDDNILGAGVLDWLKRKDLNTSIYPSCFLTIDGRWPAVAHCHQACSFLPEVASVTSDHRTKYLLQNAEGNMGLELWPFWRHFSFQSFRTWPLSSSQSGASFPKRQAYRLPCASGASYLLCSLSSELFKCQSTFLGYTLGK